METKTTMRKTMIKNNNKEKLKEAEKRGRVLLIYTEEDSTIYDVLCYAISEENELIKANSATEGLEKLRRNKIHLVVLNSEISDMKYSEVICEIRKINRLVPIILLVGWHDKQTQLEIRQLEYRKQKRIIVYKCPFLVKSFLRLIHRLVSLSLRKNGRKKEKSTSALVDKKNKRNKISGSIFSSLIFSKT